MAAEYDDRWTMLWVALMRQFGELQPTIQLRHLPPPGLLADSLGAALRAKGGLQSASKEYDAEIDAAIDKHTMRLQEAGLEGVAKAWLAVRVHMAMLHARNLAMQGNARAMLVFPPPKLTDQEVIKFLLTDWWYAKGIANYGSMLAS